MTNIAKQALKEINEKLKNSEVDNDNLLTGHRINHKKDMESNKLNQIKQIENARNK